MDQYFANPNAIDISVIPYAIGFSFYSSREIRDISNVEIICPVFFDQKSIPVMGGLFDYRMGVSSKKKLCISCRGNYISCPGHFGHINFLLPLQNPYLKNIFSKIIKTKCWYCNFFKISNWETRLTYFKFLSLNSKIAFTIQTKTNLKFQPKKPKLMKKMENFFFYFKFMKVLTQEVKKKWEFEHFPRISFVEKNKRGKFWCLCLLTFIKLCIGKECCQKCRKRKIQTNSFLGNIHLANKKFFFVNKHLIFQQNFLSFPYEQIFNFCGEKYSIIYNRQIENFNSKAFQLKKQIDDLWQHEKDFCELVWGSLGASFRFEKKFNSEIFFLSCILISPTKFRPAHFSKIKEKNTEIETNPQNYYFTKALVINQQFLLTLTSFPPELNYDLGFHSFDELEKSVSNLFNNYSDGSKNKKKNPLGIKQRLEKKFGLFRMYIMGKRVFHSARSIIIPDPFINCFEVGIPAIFAKKLNVFLPINCLNFGQLSIVMPKIDYENKINYQENKGETYFGKKYLYRLKNKKSYLTQILAICNKYKNYFLKKKFKKYGINRSNQTLRTGNFILLNRQPSLHRASLMSHLVKLTNQTKCIKIHYTNCNSYNADFDGDEMNVHFPQNILASAESLMLSLAFHHAKIPTHNILMRGLIQDNVIMAVNLTQKDTFFSEAIFFHLLSSTIIGDEKLKFSLYPAIVKPRILWTGKQLFSAILQIFLKKKWLLNLESRTKLTKIFFGKDETKILIRHGELLRGIIDSSQIGRNKHGLFHAFNEIYGNFITDKLSSVFCKSLVFFQRAHGFTSGIEDLILRKKIDKNRIKSLQKEKILSRLALRKTLATNGIFHRKFFEKIFYNKHHLKIISFLFSHRKLFEFFLRKSKNIFNKISSSVIENTILGGLEKIFHVNGFLQMTTTGAKGSALNVFQICSNLGQTELEAQFIPLGYGGKTLPIFPPFDFSYSANGYIFHRFLTGIGQPEFFFHCIAGREGLLDTSIKTSQSGYIQRSLIKHLESLKLSQDSTLRFGDGSIAQFYYYYNTLNSSAIDFEYFLPWFFQNFRKKFIKKKIESRFFFYRLHNLAVNLKKRTVKKKSIQDFFLKNKTFSIEKKNLKKITASVNLSNFLKKNCYSIWNFFLKEKKLIHLYRKNLVPPGEPLGLLSGHSLGEPCTQMTLNTFHFAGKLISKNNSGIPRLREILLIASQQPKHPTMSGFFKKNISFDMFSSFEKRINRIFFYDLIENAHSFLYKNESVYMFTFRFRIVPKKFFKHMLGFKKHEIIKQIKSFWEQLKIQFCQKNSSLIKKKNFPLKYSLKEIIFIRKKIKKKPKRFFFKFRAQAFDKNYQFLCEVNFTKLYKTNLTFFGNKTIGFEKCIREIKRIKTGFIDYKEKSVHTEGVNLYFFWKNSDIINCQKIFTNNIFSMSTIYGIEAGRKTLFYELMTIFEMQTISVNRQHIDLVSDYMMRLGFYRSFGRRGVAEENLFQKITYETAVEFLINSSINQTCELLSSTSSSISLGKICSLGTGNFHVLFKKRK